MAASEFSQRLGRPRRDAESLGFGIAFVAFGTLGLLHVAGAPVPSAWLYPAVLLGLGVAGLVSLYARARGTPER